MQFYTLPAQKTMVLCKSKLLPLTKPVIWSSAKSLHCTCSTRRNRTLMSVLSLNLISILLFFLGLTSCPWSNCYHLFAHCYRNQVSAQAPWAFMSWKEISTLLLPGRAQTSFHTDLRMFKTLLYQVFDLSLTSGQVIFLHSLLWLPADNRINFVLWITTGFDWLLTFKYFSR